jgi:hypothetical protein
MFTHKQGTIIDEFTSTARWIKTLSHTTWCLQHAAKEKIDSCLMHGPNEFNIFHVINLHTINISLCLVVRHPKIVAQTFHSQLHK